MRPSRTPYVLAGIGSLLWLGALGLYATTRWGLPLTPDQSIVPLVTTPEAALVGFAALAPLVVMFVLAQLYIRGQEMRSVARSMTQVALRLAEPETAGSEGFVSLSQAIRREVAAMGDGIERALARAGELETLVHSEIATLERAYGENEIRIRALIDELVTQREAILANAERVRSSITGSHESLRDDLLAASTRIADAVGQAGERVTQTLGEKAEEITGALTRTGDQMIDGITLRGGELIERLTTTTKTSTHASARQRPT